MASYITVINAQVTCLDRIAQRPYHADRTGSNDLAGCSNGCELILSESFVRGRLAMSKVSDHFAAEGYVGRRYLLLVLGGRVVLILVALAFGNGLLSPRALVSVMIAYAACVALRSSRKRPNRPSSWRFSTIFYITRAFRLFVL